VTQITSVWVSTFDSVTTTRLVVVIVVTTALAVEVMYSVESKAELSVTVMVLVTTSL
jgi:hypothetical protein